MNDKDRLREEFKETFKRHICGLKQHPIPREVCECASCNEIYSFIEIQLQQAKIEVLREISGKDYIRYPSSPNDPHITLKSIEERLKSLTQKEE